VKDERLGDRATLMDGTSGLADSRP